MCITPANDGKLWLGTLIGLYLYDIDNNASAKINLKYTNPERLTRILSLCKDKDNQLWIGAKESLSKYVVNEDNTLDKTGGYKFNDIVQTQCIYQSFDGKIWIGTIDGLAMVLPVLTKKPEKGQLSIRMDSRTVRFEESRRTMTETYGSVQMTDFTDMLHPRVK